MNKEKEQKAIERLKAFEPESAPYYLCYSGGKDSDAIRILAELAGVKHQCKHNLTTVDAPETVRYVRKVIGRENVNVPEKTMWQLIVEKQMPPTRRVRYCCSYLKEGGGKGYVKITGVRWAESNSRRQNGGLVKVIGKPKTMQKKAEAENLEFSITKQGGIVMNNDNADTRRFVEHCYRTTTTMVNPIIDWTDDDVWSFLHYYGCESNPLYQCGRKRIGCIGCPMQTRKGQIRDFIEYPIYRLNYVKAFDRMIAGRKAKGLGVDEDWKDGESVMKWWLGEDPAQLNLLEE